MCRNLWFLVVMIIAVLFIVSQTAISGHNSKKAGQSSTSVELTSQFLSPPPGFTYIPKVPDWNWPPLSGDSNVCAPLAALNILNYYDSLSVTTIPGIMGIVDPADAAVYPFNSNTADLISYFMGTNGRGSPARINQSLTGTHYMDQDTGLAEYIAWNKINQFCSADPSPPSWKNGYKSATKLYDGALPNVTVDTMWNYYTIEINNGRPVKIDFTYWNPIPEGTYFTDPFSPSGDNFYVYNWGNNTGASGSDDPNDPPETWTPEVGHAVTGVGYIPNWQGKNWAIVHDNWPNTDTNIVIPWNNLMAMITVSKPGFWYETINRRIPLPPDYGNHCCASPWEGLYPPGYFGIWSEAHGTNFYFPSDSFAQPDNPQSWLVPGVHTATVYGPGTANIPDNPIVTVPDRYSNACPLYVEIPAEEYMDEATDQNAIMISAGSPDMVVPIGDTVETLVLIASSDGDAFSGSDQTLEIMLEYDDITSNTVTIDDIHPAGRGDISNPEEIFIYDNELFICSPAYFDLPSPYVDPYHSAAWHWYAIYPDNTKILDNITFKSMQEKQNSNIYIFGISYSSPASQEEKGLVGHWRFEEGSGDIAYDETEYQNDGTIRNADWVSIDDCDSDSALEFHGGGQWFDGDRVLVPHSSSLDLSEELTIAAWIKASGSDTYLAIADKYRVNGDISEGFTLFLSDGKLRFAIYSGVDGYCSGDVGTSDLRDDQWHHIAAVWDGSHVRGYVDGLQEGEIAYTFPPASNTDPLGIGLRLNGWGGYMPFLGVIDEVRIYNKALNSYEIGSLACDCQPGDANGDCDINVGDAVYLISHIFKGGPGSIPYVSCSGDANYDCNVNVGDAVFIINHVFKGGTSPCACESWLLFCGQPLRNRD